MSAPEAVDERSDLLYNEFGRRGNSLLLPQSETQQAELPFSTFPNASSGNRNLFEIALVCALAIMSTITFILALFRGLSADHLGGTYFMMGFTNGVLVLLESLLIVFARNGQLEGTNARFFYAIGLLTLIHSLFTNIVMFSD